MPHAIDHPHYLIKYKDKGTKIPIFKLFNELGKIWKMQSKLCKIPISHVFMIRIENNLEINTAPDQHFKIQMLNLWMSWENFCPNLIR